MRKIAIVLLVIVLAAMVQTAEVDLKPVQASEDSLAPVHFWKWLNNLGTKIKNAGKKAKNYWKNKKNKKFKPNKTKNVTLPPGNGK